MPIMTFTNPYKDARRLEADDPRRLVSDIARADFDYVKCLRTTQGTITTTVNILFQKLVNELKRRGITDISDKRRFEDFVVRCRLILPEDVGDLTGSPVGGAAQQANGGDDVGGTTGSGATDESVSQQPTGVSGSRPPARKPAKRSK